MKAGPYYAAEGVTADPHSAHLHLHGGGELEIESNFALLKLSVVLLSWVNKWMSSGRIFAKDSA